MQLLHLILSSKYAEEIRQRVNEKKTQPLDYYEPMFEPQSGIKIYNNEKSQYFCFFSKIMELAMSQLLMPKEMPLLPQVQSIQRK
jgi:hypothetical protein